MEVTIGRITALCPACGHDRFRTRKKQLKSDDLLTCSGCATRTAYGSLLQQITRRSIAASDAALAAARSRRRPRP